MSQESVNQFLPVAFDDEGLSEELSEDELKFVVGGSMTPETEIEKPKEEGEPGGEGCGGTAPLPPKPTTGTIIKSDL